MNTFMAGAMFTAFEHLLAVATFVDSLNPASLGRGGGYLGRNGRYYYCLNLSRHILPDIKRIGVERFLCNGIA